MDCAHLFDLVWFAVAELWTYALGQFDRGWDGWLWFFMPLFLLVEFPRYVFPGLALPILSLFKIPRDDSRAWRDFLTTRPTVSVLLVGYNEEDSVAKAIRSLLELTYPIEIIVIDDGSVDRMYEVAKPFADAGQIKLYRNSAASGRSGRPSTSNLALHLSSGEFILSVDADTSFDRDTIERMIGPFYDPAVGVVAGNLMPRNAGDTFWTRMQAIEYTISIGMWKRWLGLFGMNMQASGAFGAFRRTALERVGAWDPELAEDADLSLKLKKSGWKLVFSPWAMSMTNVPSTFKILVGQRIRWDKGAFRTYFRKHVNIMNPLRFDVRNMLELAQEWFFSVAVGYLFIIYCAYMAWMDWRLLVFALVASYAVYVVCTFISFGAGVLFSKSMARDARLLPWALLYPAYKEIFRWTRIYAVSIELLHINYEEGYLPQSAWRNTPKW